MCEERSLALQILCDEPELIHKKEMTDWDLYDLQRRLFEALRCSSYTYLILLDGLDKLFQLNENTGKLFSILESLSALDGVKLCVSSRPERLFADKFRSNQSLRMQDLTKGDIRKYTTDFLKDLHLEPDEELHLQILHEMIHKAEGVFLWVYVVLQRIKNDITQYGETWDGIYELITQLPPDLIRLYKDMWTRLGDKNEKYVMQAARYFQFLQHGSTFDMQTVAFLATIADEEFLDALIIYEGIPSECFKRWVKNERRHLQNASLSLRWTSRSSDSRHHAHALLFIDVRGPAKAPAMGIRKSTLYTQNRH